MKSLAATSGTWFTLCAAALCVAVEPSTRPPMGLRDNTPAMHAIVGARLVIAPGQVLESGTLLVQDGVIAAVGADEQPPAGAVVHQMPGKTLYPGFVDAYSLAAGSPPATAGDYGYWNPHIRPQYAAAADYSPDANQNRLLRSQGVVARLLVPAMGVIRGTSALVSTADGPAGRLVIEPQVALHVQLTPPGAGRDEGYPNSPMGAVALVRQAFYDADWYRRAHLAWKAQPQLPPPEQNQALEFLSQWVAEGRLVMIDAPDELYVLRAHKLAREFALNVLVRASGQEYQRLGEVRAAGLRLVVPVAFPAPPDVRTAELAFQARLADLLHWDLAPENPARLAASGVEQALTSHGLADPGQFLAAVRKAVARGLDPTAALAALTTVPAGWLGVGERLGSLEPGKMASFLVVEGDLFSADGRIVETWVGGSRYVVERQPPLDVRGTWELVATGPDGMPMTFVLELGGTRAVPAGRWKLAETLVPLADVQFTDACLRARFDAAALHTSGQGWLSLSLVANREEPVLTGHLIWPDGVLVAATARRTSSEVPDLAARPVQTVSAETGPAELGTSGGAGAVVPTGTAVDTASAADAASAIDAGAGTTRQATLGPGTQNPPPERHTIGLSTAQQAAEGAAPAQAERAAPGAARALFEVNYPLGAYGSAGVPEQPPAVLFANATVWTGSEQGILTEADVLVERGLIAAVGKDLHAPDGALVIDLAGKHLTAGVIDCHSHIATDGGVNETGQAITAEVRIGDFIDPEDIAIYRQLAGGVTCANILHGSANPIGGQCQVIKFRWGAGPEEMKFAEAPPCIKFALGENVKQSNWGDRFTTRYPQTRMGVEQIIQDAFLAAQEYRREWEAWREQPSGIPPRVDLELEALAEVLEGRRLLHCHSYRQDEILAFLRTCEQFGVRVATLQHVLEGYKLADVIARHGAGASAFSDWWAYKFEVYDAIPYNGALMHRAGVVVTFNSDDADLGRRLHLEAAKAVKYGGVPPEEAWKFVTLNAARQMGIDRWVGSIEPGKHADLAVWSAPPMSGAARCEQTWIDGRKYYDIADDAQRRERAREMRAALVQRVLASGETPAPSSAASRWPRSDEFCPHCHAHP